MTSPVGNTNSVSCFKSLNALAPMFVTVFGRLNATMFVQPTNASADTSARSSGSVRLFIEPQPENIPGTIGRVTRPDSLSSTTITLSIFPYADGNSSASVANPSGTVTPVNLRHSMNAPAPTFVTLHGIDAESIRQQFENATSPISTTPSGISTVIN